MEHGTLAAVTAQDEVRADGAWQPPAPYESAHGRPHGDTLDWPGTALAEDRLPAGRSVTDPITVAKNDLKANAERDRDDLVRGQP